MNPHIAWGVVASLFLTATALAQPETLPEVPPPPAGDDLAARVARLEEQSRQRDAELAQALSRVGELESREQGAAEEEAAPAAPTLRPLASLVTRFEHREGYDRIGVVVPGACITTVTDGDCLRYRARAGFVIEPLQITPDVRASVRFLPQVAGYWALPTLALTPGGPTTPSSSGGTFDPTLGLHEGYLSLQIGQPVRIDIGRFEMVYGEHLTIGNLDWHPNGRAFDGARMRVQPDQNGLWVDAFWTMLSEGGLPAFGQNDNYFYGVYAGLGPAIAQGLSLDAYALVQQSNDAIDPVSSNVTDFTLRVTLGGRFRHRVEMVDLRAESALQVGSAGAVRPAPRQTILAGHFDAEVGVNLLEDRLRLALEGLFASGNGLSPDVNEAYDQLYPTAHAFLGLSDVIGARRNVTGGVFHATVKPIPQLAINFDLHVFLRPEAPADNYAGTEGNLGLIWTPGAGFRTRAMYALFIPNAGF
ncbi:MAG: alginate export family protein, partial [Sandaracinaceae bacterium]|nr:alginate export family protein [Sandaracinaceae bacterium]